MEEIEVKITDLKVTAEDDFMKDHIEKRGSSVKFSPHFAYLSGIYWPEYKWMKNRGLDLFYQTRQLMQVLKSLSIQGQLEPIKIYEDMRINTGHKRAACMLFLGFETIRAVIVADDYKL